jgi:hypothetical protein
MEISLYSRDVWRTSLNTIQTLVIGDNMEIIGRENPETKDCIFCKLIKDFYGIDKGTYVFIEFFSELIHIYFDKNKEDSIDFDLANDVWLNKKFRFERFLYNNSIVTEDEFNKLRNDCYYGKDFITWDKQVTKWYEDYYSKRFTDKVITIEIKAVLTCM